MKTISDKRRARLEISGEKLGWNSTLKAKPHTMKRTPIRKVSKKAEELWEACRQRVFDKWGKQCYLCRRREGNGVVLDCHHIDSRTGKASADKYNEERIIPLCNRTTGCKAHSHSGKDKRFFILKVKIEEKMKGTAE